MNEPVLIFPKEVRHIERKIHEVLDIMGLPPKQETAVKKKIHYALWMYLDDPLRTVYDQEKVQEVMWKARRKHDEQISLVKKA